MQARVVVDTDAGIRLRTQRERELAILAAAGFAREVDRVRLEWPAGSPAPERPGRLRFEPADDLPAAELERVFAEVADGSVDHGMRHARTRLGRYGEARDRLDAALRRKYPRGWFAVGIDRGGSPVGYVQSALVDGGERAILAEIGVVASRRGHRFVDEFLALGTAVVLAGALRTLRSDTDQENRAMRAAFVRAGYVEFATRHDYRWVAPSQRRRP